jgi:hypothetical protein
MDPEIEEVKTWRLTKAMIIEAFEIDVPEGYDTYSYYRDNELEIRLIKIEEAPPGTEPDPVVEE